MQISVEYPISSDDFFKNMENTTGVIELRVIDKVEGMERYIKFQNCDDGFVMISFQFGLMQNLFIEKRINSKMERETGPKINAMPIKSIGALKTYMKKGSAPREITRALILMNEYQLALPQARTIDAEIVKFKLKNGMQAIGIK